MGVPVAQRLPKSTVCHPRKMILSRLANMAAGALYLSKLSGGEVTFQLAREVLSPFGAIEELWYSTPTDREVNRLPEGTLNDFESCECR